MQSFSTSDNIPQMFFSNPTPLSINNLTPSVAPQSLQSRQSQQSQYINTNNIAVENYNNCGGGLATLDRVQYYPGDPPRYRNNNQECRTNDQCASGYCNMTISGSPAQNVYNAWNQPNVRIGVCADVDNGLPSDLQPILPPQERCVNITINDVIDVKEKYGTGHDRNFDDLFNDCIYRTYWNGVPDSYPPLPLAQSCRQIVNNYKHAMHQQHHGQHGQHGQREQ